MLYRPPKPLPPPDPPGMSWADRIWWAITYALIAADLVMLVIAYTTAYWR